MRIALSYIVMITGAWHLLKWLASLLGLLILGPILRHNERTLRRYFR